jgi:3-phosphoshikimate 1-carboxyvinyltransferase
MNYIVTRPVNPIKADIVLPPSKSISNRLLILNALANHHGHPDNLAVCDDTRVLKKALDGGNSFDLHAAGTAMRFLSAFCALTPGEWFLTGSARMKQRPIAVLVDALRGLGASIDYVEQEGFPPLKIRGGLLTGGELTLPGDVSSQYLSALLMIAPKLQRGLTLHIQGDIVSLPYIDLTLHLLALYGIDAQWIEDGIRIDPQPFRPPSHISVEPDWSAASYWYEIVALLPNSEIFLHGLKPDSPQGDSKCAEIFAHLGTATEFDPHGAFLRSRPSRCAALHYDFSQQPDLAQAVAATCAAANIPFRLAGLQTLRIKETDRIEALRRELLKFGFPLVAAPSILAWNGTRLFYPLPYPVVRTYKDHRMAMAFAPLVLVRAGGLILTDVAVVDKSYPQFWEHLASVGFRIKESESDDFMDFTL